MVLGIVDTATTMFSFFSNWQNCDISRNRWRGIAQLEVMCSEMYSSVKSLCKCSGPNIEKNGNVGQL